MRLSSKIISAKPLREWRRSGRVFALYGEIECNGPEQYVFLLAAHKQGEKEPRLMVWSEVNRTHTAAVEGRYSMGVFDGKCSYHQGSSDAWGNEEKFFCHAVYLALYVYKGVFEPWDYMKIDDPENPGRLIEELTAEEFSDINSKLSRYQALGPMWWEFLRKCQHGDVLWRCRMYPWGNTSLCIVRSDCIVDNFSVFCDL